MFSLFGISFYPAKLVPILLSIISLFFFCKILKKTIQNKNALLIILLLYTLNPLIVFNHYTLRDYTLYEAFFIISIYLLIKINEYIEKEKLKKLPMPLIALVLINSLNWFSTGHNGKYTVALATIIGISTIFIKNNFDKFFPKNKKFALIKNFLSKRKNRIALNLTVLLIGFFTHLGKVKSIVNYEHFPPNDYNFWNLFFDYFLLSTIFLTIGFLTAIIKKKSKLIIIYIVFLFLLSLHLCSSLEIHHWRSIAYLMPVFVLLSFFGATQIYPQKKSAQYLITPIALIAFFTPYLRIMPDNYFQIGPTIPEYADSNANTDMASTSKFIKEKFGSSYTIIEGIRGFGLPSPKIFNIPIKYKLNVTKKFKQIEQERPPRKWSWYYDKNNQVHSIYSNIPAITLREDFKRKIKEDKTVFVLSEEAILGSKNLFTLKDLNYIEKTHPNKKTFTGIRIYWK
jgi:hypothetical protein